MAFDIILLKIIFHLENISVKNDSAVWEFQFEQDQHKGFFLSKVNNSKAKMLVCLMRNMKVNYHIFEKMLKISDNGELIDTKLMYSFFLTLNFVYRNKKPNTIAKNTQ